MKRRLDNCDLRDVTDSPHLAMDEDDGHLSLHEPPLLLENDALWLELVTARETLRVLESRVRQVALQNVPLDEVEVTHGRALWRMIDGRVPYDSKGWDRIQADLLAHAKRK